MDWRWLKMIEEFFCLLWYLSTVWFFLCYDCFVMISRWFWWFYTIYDLTFYVTPYLCVYDRYPIHSFLYSLFYLYLSNSSCSRMQSFSTLAFRSIVSFHLIVYSTRFPDKISLVPTIPSFPTVSYSILQYSEQLVLLHRTKLLPWPTGSVLNTNWWVCVCVCALSMRSATTILIKNKDNYFCTGSASRSNCVKAMVNLEYITSW